MKKFEKRMNLLKTNDIKELNVIIRKKQINLIQSVIEFDIEIKKQK